MHMVSFSNFCHSRMISLFIYCTQQCQVHTYLWCMITAAYLFDLFEFQTPENGTTEKRPSVPKTTTRSAVSKNGSSAPAANKSAGIRTQRYHFHCIYIIFKKSLLFQKVASFIPAALWLLEHCTVAEQ